MVMSGSQSDAYATYFLISFRMHLIIIFMLTSFIHMKTLLLRDGSSIAFQRWGCSTNSKKVLCLHGWMDNSNSFAHLGPYLSNLGYDVVAVDMVGHGRSSNVPI